MISGIHMQKPLHARQTTVQVRSGGGGGRGDKECSLVGLVTMQCLVPYHPGMQNAIMIGMHASL